jgi:hypothetical protein
VGIVTKGIKKSGDSTRKASNRFFKKKKKKKNSTRDFAHDKEVLQSETGSLSGGMHHWFKGYQGKGNL